MLKTIYNEVMSKKTPAINLTPKIIIMIYLILVKYIIIPNFNTPLIVTEIINSILYYCFVTIAINYLTILIINSYKKKNNLPEDSNDNFMLGVKRIAFVINIILLIVILLKFFGIQIETLITSISIFAAALTLIFKEILQNFISGFMVMFSKNITLGQYIKIGDYRGRVKDINFLTIELQNEFGESIYVPNSLLFSKEVINYSKLDTKMIRCDLVLDIKNMDKIDQFTSYIKDKMLLDFVSEINKKDVTYKIDKIQKDSISIIFEFIIKKYNYELEKKIRFECSKHAIEFLSKNN